MRGYLTSRGLEGLKSYQYKPSGYTILDELHQPVWNCECTWPWRRTRPSGGGSNPQPAALGCTGWHRLCTACQMRWKQSPTLLGVP